jgi:hypothetical protein
MVPGRGLEPPRRCQRQHLKLVRLPIPPSGHVVGLASAAISVLGWALSTPIAPARQIGKFWRLIIGYRQVRSCPDRFIAAWKPLLFRTLFGVIYGR